MTTRVTIVAEAAQGFEGDQVLARLLVRAAARGGADLVKFQLVYADELAVPSYQYHGLFQRLEMPAAAWQGVCAEAERLGLGVAFDVFGMRSLEEALALGARAVKVHATDFFNHALVDSALRRAPQVYVSLGGIATDEVAVFLERHRSAGSDRVILMCGYQAEPTPLDTTNLARLGAMQQRFPGLRLGYMDHADASADEGAWLGVLALPYGVTVIEKHITLDRALELEDSVSALRADEFRAYVGRVRAAELAIGSANLDLTEKERGYRGRALKAVVTATVIAKGTALTADTLSLRRAPVGDGPEPLRRLEDAVGHRATRDLPALAALYAGDVA